MQIPDRRCDTKMTATTMLVLVVTAVVTDGVWSETFIPSLRDEVISEEPLAVTTFDPYAFPEYTTLDPILVDDTDFDSTTIPAPDDDPDYDLDYRPVTVPPPVISARRIPSLSSSSFRVRPAFASRKGSVQGLTPRKISPVIAPVITPRKEVSSVRLPSSREIVVFNSRKLPKSIAAPIPTARKMPSLSSRKNSALTDTSRETLVSDYSPAFTTRKLPALSARKFAAPVSTPRENPILSVLRIRPVPSSILRNRQPPSSLSPSPVEFPESFPPSTIIVQRPSTTPSLPVTVRSIPAPSFPIRVQRPAPVPSFPILIKRPSPVQSSSIRMQRPISVPAPSSIRITPLGWSPALSSTEKRPGPIFGKRPDPPTTSSSSSGFGKSFDSSPAPIQTTPITHKVKFPSFPTPPKRPVSYQFTSSENSTNTFSSTSTSVQPDVPSPSWPDDSPVLVPFSFKNTPVASPSWPEDSLTITRSSLEMTTHPSRSVEFSPISISSSPKDSLIASKSSSEYGPKAIPSFPPSLNQSAPLQASRLSPTPMLRLTAPRSPLPAPRGQPSSTVAMGPRNRFLIMLKRKQEAKNNNVIGKSPCPRGTEGQTCRRRLAMTSRTCSSGSCQKCRRGCSSMEPSEWPTCCRDHLLCCRHLAASCRRCDHPQLFPFCSAAFKKCV